jgi:hypothetical protein
MKINDFVSCKDSLPKEKINNPLSSGWVLGRIGGSITNFKTVRYIKSFNKWQNRDYSWCEEEITHWCAIENDKEDEENKFFSDSEELGLVALGLVAKEDITNICDTAVALTLLKFLEVLVTTGSNPTKQEMESIRDFSDKISKEMVDELFNQYKKKKNIQEPISTPAAYLFANGNAAYFDRRGEQIPTLQSKGWIAIHDFVKIYPNAPISVQKADPIPKDLVDRFLKNIKQIEELPY